MELAWLQIIFSLLSGYQFQFGTASLVTGFVLILVTRNAFAWSFQLSLLVLLVLSLLLWEPLKTPVFLQIESLKP